MTEIIIALITGGLSLVGVIISNSRSNAKVESKIVTAQAVTDCKIDELTREVREHNNFAKRMPVVEEKIKAIDRRIDNMENEIRSREVQ